MLRPMLTILLPAALAAPAALTPVSRLVNSDMPVSLPEIKTSMLQAVTEEILLTLIHECPSEHTTTTLRIESIEETQQRIVNNDAYIYDLVVSVRINDEPPTDLGIELKEDDTEEESDGIELVAADISVLSMTDYSFLPKCVQERIKRAQADFEASEKPADDEAAAEAAAEKNKPQFGHATNSSNQSANEIRATSHEDAPLERLLRAVRTQKAEHKTYHRRNHVVVDQYHRIAGEDYHLGLIRNASVAITAMIPTQHEVAYASSLPANFNPFDGSQCLEKFPARNQAGCGSCYAFAASTALSLSFCHARKKNGASTDDSPVLTAQGIVSCGSRQGFNSGCNGGNMQKTAECMPPSYSAPMTQPWYTSHHLSRAGRSMH